ALRLWAVETVIVEGHSMVGMLEPGDRVLVIKMLQAKRLDVVVLEDPSAGGPVIKRLIGMPGDTISMTPYTVRRGNQVIALGSQLYIDGTPQDEAYATSLVPVSMPPIQMGDDEYFVAGDNRDASIDSRRYGPVAGQQMIGVGVAVIYPVTRARLIRRPSALQE
ncbi:MAG: signal peptidase I, partial [Proteobacteria bacterium]|nr:signal peptidase I [Pseudomonadota bacterium]